MKISKITEFISKNLNSLAIFLLIIVAFFLGLLTNQLISLSKYQAVRKTQNLSSPNKIDLAKLQERVLSSKGYQYKIIWGDLGKQMINDGVIDEVKLAQALVGKDELPQNFKKYLNGEANKIELTQENAHFWLDVLWGLGLANKNKLLDEGDMQKYDNPANFASTGGYTISTSKPMDFYSKFSYLPLSEKQQTIVSEIAGDIYRPCCNNSTAFPDCNHGMAMLALIELMVSQNFSKDEIYKVALNFNTYWFPQTYLDIAYHFEKNNRDYKKVSPREILSKTFSSGAGYAVVRKGVGPLAWPALAKGGGCGA